MNKIHFCPLGLDLMLECSPQIYSWFIHLTFSQLRHSHPGETSSCIPQKITSWVLLYFKWFSLMVSIASHLSENSITELFQDYFSIFVLQLPRSYYRPAVFRLAVAINKLSSAMEKSRRWFILSTFPTLTKAFLKTGNWGEMLLALDLNSALSLCF